MKPRGGAFKMVLSGFVTFNSIKWRKNNMAIKIGAFGYGLAAILGAGSILLAAIGNENWRTFLFMAVGLWIISVVLRKARF
jgi:hypothetical protein